MYIANKDYKLFLIEKTTGRIEFDNICAKGASPLSMDKRLNHLYQVGYS